MPNHIYNVVTFDCSHERTEEILKAVEMEGCGLGSIDFEKLIPMPDDVYRGPLGAKEMAMYPGEKNWYDFSVRFWGSKWNSYGYDYLPKKDDALVFNTAWSAVPQVIAKLSETYPEVTVDYCWADEDFGSNTGRLQFKNGEVIDGYIPADQSPEAYEFAAAVQDSTLEDFGYVLDKDTGNVRYMEEVTPQEAQKPAEKAKGAER
jgi:hypothetical protein